MLWHAELLIEACLIAVIIWRKPQMRWWEALIGVDFVSGLFQLIPYREHLRMHSRIMWACGVILAGPLLWKSLLEIRLKFNSSLIQWHTRILAAWIVLQLTCVTLQTQQDWVLPVNHFLLVADSVCFLAWISLFLVS